MCYLVTYLSIDRIPELNSTFTSMASYAHLLLIPASNSLHTDLKPNIWNTFCVGNVLFFFKLVCWFFFSPYL